jgi:hypothetical protein
MNRLAGVLLALHITRIACCHCHVTVPPPPPPPDPTTAPAGPLP